MNKTQRVAREFWILHGNRACSDSAYASREVAIDRKLQADELIHVREILPDEPASSDAEKEFCAWFAKNYPGPDTVIFDPHWHAPKIFRAATARAEEKLKLADLCIHANKVQAEKIGELKNELAELKSRAEKLTSLVADMAKCLDLELEIQPNSAYHKEIKSFFDGLEAK